MKVKITKKLIFLDSENEKETQSIKDFVFGDEKHGIPRILFLNGASESTNKNKAGIAITKVSEDELNLECLKRWRKSVERRHFNG